MKKNLRLLCLGLAAATFTCSFAQEAQNMTDKLTNADMELGLKGWGFDGEKLMGKNTKNPAVQTGFYGMANGVLEAWNGNGNGLANAYIMQRIGNLPNGTYVFGANIGASKQYHRKAVTVTVNGKDVTKYEYWSNLDSVKGVELFANEAIVPVATNNPDYNNMVTADGSLYTDGHAMKFNVAVTLTDEDEKPGYMDAGLRYVGTNANYVVWDNATLYYFGEGVSEEAALEAMAKIDVANAIAIADTLKNTHIANDTLKNLTEALAAAEKAEFTAANFNDVLEVVYRAAGLARKSAADYKALANNLEDAKVVAAGTWRESNAMYVGFLNDAIAAAEAAYAAKEMNREELTALRKELNWSAGDVKYDSLYIAVDALNAFIDAARNLEGQPGGYTAIQIQGLQDLKQELNDTMTVYEADAELDFAERTINPNGLYGYIARIYAAIESVKNNPISTEYTQMPIVFKQAEDGWVEGTSMYDQSAGVVGYISPMYRFQGKISNFRVTVKKNKSGNAFFCLSALEFYDGNGQKIELTEDDLSTNADHNTLNPENPDGGGIAALFDDDQTTFFHSAWQNMPADAHYLEVNLPNGGYDAFSFRMLGRANNGWDQSHTFPAEMVISTPAPKRDALETLINQAKAYDAYSFPEVGYYEYDHSYLTDVIAEAEALVNSFGSEDDCVAMATKLSEQMAKFELSEEKSIRLPEPGKEYRIISAVPAFYNLQSVEKALTVHAADTTLWWENVCADSLQQTFIFEPICEEGETFPFVKVETGENPDGTTWEETYYCYAIKNVKYNSYIDSTFTGDPARLHLAAEIVDTVLLKHLGRGQWNIIAGGTLHAGDHNSGNPSESKGAYGGIYGISSGICPYGGGLDGASAWYIREYSALPLAVAVEGAEFKSEFIRFASANTIKLTADKACAFDGLALYDLYGAELAIDTVVVKGNVATITPAKNLVGCSFAFNNAEGVASVEFDAYHFISKISLLEEAYEVAVAVAPVEGENVGEYADIAEYTAAIEAAEAMIEAGAATDAEVEAMIARLEAAVEGLAVNLPVEGKYYFIYNAVEAFEKNNGYKMALYTADYDLKWGHENHLDYNRYWQFELATEEELSMLIEDEKTIKNLLGKAYYLKSVGTELYIADGATSAQVGLTDDKEAAIPYLVNVFGVGKEVSFDGLGQAGKRIHANGHGGGAGKGSNIVYWSSGAGTASAWHVVETQYDVTDIDFTEIETEQAVVKGAYDLFGRRIVAPTAPGIYIIDGKKKYIKK